VYAAAVILPKEYDLPGLNDSKKLTAKKREVLFGLIREQAVAFCIASASVAEIEELNILESSLLAMRRAVEGLSVRPQLLLVDGNCAKGFQIKAEAVVGGDGLHPCISAASVLAKVSRDLSMTELDKLYPQYGFAKHKGYGTAAHIQAIREHGPSTAHRKLFIRKVFP
jgi:ribonuclease HII